MIYWYSLFHEDKKNHLASTVFQWIILAEFKFAKNSSKDATNARQSCLWLFNMCRIFYTILGVAQQVWCKKEKALERTVTHSGCHDHYMVKQSVKCMLLFGLLTVIIQCVLADLIIKSYFWFFQKNFKADNREKVFYPLSHPVGQKI